MRRVEGTTWHDWEQISAPSYLYSYSDISSLASALGEVEYIQADIPANSSITIDTIDYRPCVIRHLISNGGSFLVFVDFTDIKLLERMR